MLTKAQIRSKILKRFKIEKEDTRDRKSRLVTQKLLRTKVFKKAKNVMFYIALGGEVDTTEMIQLAKRLGKIVTVPVCKKNKAALKPCILDEHAGLKKGPYGVLEPAVAKTVRPENLDLVIVPGLAFDRKGNRLGRGKGYYDRFLKTLSKGTPSIGLAFGFQVLPSVPVQPHDVAVKKLLFA